MTYTDVSQRYVPYPPRHLLILNAVLLAIFKDGRIPPITLEPPVLHDLHTPAAVRLEGLQDLDIVRVTDSDKSGFARVLQRDKDPPRVDGAPQRVERRVQKVAIDVFCTKIFQGVVQGVGDLCLKACLRVIWQRLREVVSTQRGESTDSLSGLDGCDDGGGRTLSG